MVQHMIVSILVDAVIDQHLEFTLREGGICFPYPFVSFNIFKCDAFIPAQITPFSSDKELVRKANIIFHSDARFAA